MKTLRKAAQMALDFIEDLPSTPETYSLCRELNKALALPDAPVMWQELDNEGVPMCDEGTFCEDATAFDNSRPLYTAPQPAVPEKPTDDEILTLAHRTCTTYAHVERVKYGFTNAELLQFAHTLHAKQTGSKP